MEQFSLLTSLTTFHFLVHLIKINILRRLEADMLQLVMLYTTQLMNNLTKSHKWEE